MLTGKTQMLLTGMLLCIATSAIFAQPSAGENSIVYTTGAVQQLSDTTRLFTIRDIEIQDDKRTREKIILRELPFAIGEQYPLHILIDKFAQAKQQLLNTSLFESVVVSLNNTSDNDATVLVTVKERWYFFPVPFVDVVDNNMQEWLKDMDLSRVNYGVKLKHKNISGLNDKLSVHLVNGYTKGIAVRYEGLPLDYNLHWSGNFGYATGKNRDLSYATINNKQVSYNGGDRFVYSYTNYQVSTTYRPAIKTKHTFGIGFHKEQYMDTISKLNTHYMYNQSGVSYPELFYHMQYQDLDFVPYPTKGYAADIVFQKKGLNNPINLWQLTARTTAYRELSPKYFINVALTGVIKLPFEQPYTEQQFVGHNNIYMQGYEGYIIDGVAGAFTKASINRNFINSTIPIHSKRFKCLNDIPVKLYGKVFGNTGYVYNEQRELNPLNNRMLYSGGVGIDIVLFYDVTFRFEYSINHLGQNGLYLHDRVSL